VAAGAVQLESVSLDGDDVYWIERRPAEEGRSVVVKRTAAGEILDVTPAGTNVRSRVHEYGGGAYLVDRGTLYYSNFDDQRLYRLPPDGSPTPMTPAGEWYYADGAMDPRRPRLVCVREDHTAGDREPVNTLVVIDLEASPSAGEVIAEGYDFYSTPRFSPEGSVLSWLSWRHPQMPWDGTELWIASASPDGRFQAARCVAGGASESIVQPGWSPDGVLHFVSDRNGWWNLYRVDDGRIEPVLEMEADFAGPQWTFGMSTWAFATELLLVVSYVHNGRWQLATIDRTSGTFSPVPVPFEPFRYIAATHGHAIFVGQSPTAPEAIVRVDLAKGITEVIREAAAMVLDPRYVSEPMSVEFPTDGDVTARAFYYPPWNPDFIAPIDEHPPLIVVSHGGPTSAASPALNLKVQYWTTRGFAVVDVDYGGSAGYGRAYRQRLNGRWGEVDVADCVNAARYLVAEDKADPRRLIIRGASAGGFTTLAALVFRPEIFKVGASYYGVSDLEALARDTHKFESRYTDTLIGPYPVRRDLYRARSPIHAVDRLSCPLIFFHGLEDKVIPLSQALTMAAAVRAKGLPVALLTFEGEQHGFRKEATIVRCLEAELYFYGAVLGFTPADPVPSFSITDPIEG
jgi:dipeptidyl aminopeptidase/acylaminoacyl peptidase